MLCSMSVAALAAEPMTEADTVSTMISAADTLPSVSAYPAEVRASEENGVYRLEKVYYLTAKDDPATIPTADFEREGRTYTLLDLLKNDQTETDTREHIEVVTLESKTKDMAEILKMLEPKLEVKTEDGYEGVLSLDHTTIQVEAAGYGTSSRTVTAERTYYKTHACKDTFTCKVCGRLCTPQNAGSDHRNHCPNCLSSLHVDIEPGDRASDCGGIMEPVAVWVRRGGEWAIIHRCKRCGALSSNRVAADDNPMKLMSIAMKPLCEPPFPLDRIEEMTALMGGDGRLR